MSPRRGPGWIPKLSYFPPRQCGRVRIPGKGVAYLGKAGCWKSKKSKPPLEVIEEYNREITAWMASRTVDGQDGTPLSQGCTIAELAASYLDFATKTFRKRDKPTSYVAAIKDALKPLITLFASQPAEQFTAADLRAYRDHVEREGVWSRITINAALGRIRKMFQWGASERDLFSSDVWLRLKGVGGLQRHRTTAREPKGDKPVLVQLVEAVLPHLPPMIAAMVQLQQVTGMRGIEVCFMRANEITEEPDGLWKYVASDDANKLAHKGIPKIVYLGPRAQNILLPWLTEAKKKAPDAYLWPKKRSAKNISSCFYAQKIRQACDAAAIERWHPRQLRHYVGTEVRKQFGKEGSMATLGHNEPETNERYSWTAVEDLARKVAKKRG